MVAYPHIISGIQPDMQNTVFTDVVDPSEYFQSNT